MFTSLDPLHSYDPFEILKAIYRLIFGGASGAADWASRMHDLFLAFLHSLPFYFINLFAKFIVFSFFFSIAMFILLVINIRRYKQITKKFMDKIIPASGEKEKSTGGGIIENPKWTLVLKDISSSDPGKWKLA